MADVGAVFVEGLLLDTGLLQGLLGLSLFLCELCQERDYRLRETINELGMTLRDEEPTAPAMRFKQSPGP